MRRYNSDSSLFRLTDFFLTKRSHGARRRRRNYHLTCRQTGSGFVELLNIAKISVWSKDTKSHFSLLHDIIKLTSSLYVQCLSNGWLASVHCRVERETEKETKRLMRQVNIFVYTIILLHLLFTFLLSHLFGRRVALVDDGTAVYQAHSTLPGPGGKTDNAAGHLGDKWKTFYVDRDWFLFFLLEFKSSK